MKKPFNASQFTPGHDDAEQKARFANHFVRFVESGFKPTIFPDWFYRRLSTAFGHIAHFNRGGFYATWFHTDADRRAFLENAMRWSCCGDPEFTYCDVERALRRWIVGSGLIAELTAKIDAAAEAGERATLARLKAKYEPPLPARRHPHRGRWSAMSDPAFQIMSAANTAEITLNDNLDDAKRHSREAAPTETWLIGRSAIAVALAVFSYAKKHGIPPRDVGHSIRYPKE